MSRRKFIYTGVGAAAVVAAGAAAYYYGTQPSVVQPTATTLQPTATTTASDIADAIRAEGAKLTIAGWEEMGYGETALAPGFAKWVKDTYGVDVDAKWVPHADLGIPIPKLEILASAGKPLSDAGYDVVGAEWSWYNEYAKRGFVEPFVFGSISQSMKETLMPKLSEVPAAWQGPDRVQFQAFGWIQPIVNVDHIDISKFKDWKDFADPQFKGHLVVRDKNVYSGRMSLIGLIKSLGMDPWQEDSWISAMKWFKANIAPNVLTYATSWGQAMQLLQSGEAWAFDSAWDSWWRVMKARNVNVGEVNNLPTSGCPNDPGFNWVLKDCKHPVLSRLWINWTLGPDYQFMGYYRDGPDQPVINRWNLEEKDVLMICEGPIVPKDQDKMPPQLMKYYPTADTIQKEQIVMNTDYFTLDKQNWIYEQWQQIVKKV